MEGVVRAGERVDKNILALSKRLLRINNSDYTYIAHFRMKRFLSIFTTVVLLLTGAYFLWSALDRTPPPVNVQLNIDSTFELNKDLGKGNVIGINAFMVPDDYASRQHFFSKLDGYLNVCKQKKWLNAKTVVIFPEYIGTWLVIEGEKRSAFKAPTIDKALTGFVLSNFFSYIRSWFMSPDSAQDKVKHAVFATKGQRMAYIYTRVFSELARKYGITIIAGSTLLQDPEVRRNRIVPHNGSLENITAVFNPDGSIQGKLSRKAFPIGDELPFIKKCAPSDLPVYSLPIGKTSVMICADSWYPDSYKSVEQDGLQLIAVPSFTQTDHSMGTKWVGYSGFDEPADVDTTDIGKITLRDAWLKYTMPSRIGSINTPYGMTVSLRGNLWDLGTDGELIVYDHGKVFCPAPMPGASMVSLWIR
jgi:predicted amidohydrolase